MIPSQSGSQVRTMQDSLIFGLLYALCRVSCFRFNAFLLQSYEKAGNLQNKSPDILGGLNKLSKLNKRFFEREAGAISFIYYN